MSTTTPQTTQELAAALSNGHSHENGTAAADAVEVRKQANRDAAKKSREKKRAAENERAAEIAREIANFSASFSARDAEILREIVGRRSPVEFAFRGAPEAVANGDKREKLLAWTIGTMPKDDPARLFLRGMAVEVRRDERTPIPIGRGGRPHPALWGRKVGALLLGLDRVRSGGD